MRTPRSTPQSIYNTPETRILVGHQSLSADMTPEEIEGLRRQAKAAEGFEPAAYAAPDFKTAAEIRAILAEKKRQPRG